MSEQIADLRHTIDVVGGASWEDASTLNTGVVMHWRMPGMANESRFHVRAFRPSGELHVVVAKILLGGGTDGSYQWIQVEPPGKFRDPDSGFGVIQAVRFEEPLRRPGRRRLNHEELEQLAGGAVRVCHVSGYTVAGMVELGVLIVCPETILHRPGGLS